MLFWRLALAISGGVSASLAFPRQSLWPVIFVSIAMLLQSVRQASTKGALGVGYVGGLAFYLAHIPWIGVYLGPVPWIALSAFEAFVFSLGMVAISVVWRHLDHLKFGRWQIAITALSISTIWVAREWLSGQIPYGGFPWARLALSQSESYLGRWVWFGGTSWLSLVIAFAAATALLLLTAQLKRHQNSSAQLVALVIAVASLITPLLLPISNEAEAGTIRIAAVQGNAKAGLLANEIRGSILKNHLDASEQIQASDKPDVVVWPENAADLSPLINDSAKRGIADLTKRLDAPLIFGVITARGEDIYNSSVIWQPALGAVDYYDKQRPVPFGEYVPDRWLWRSIAPDLIDLIPRGYSFGEREGIFEVPNNADAKLGILICFEIAIDDLSRKLVSSGAEVIIAQTNNADFGRSDESLQQLAIARLRAIETGRSLVNISTVGTSAIFLPDGTEIDRLPTYTAGVMQQVIPKRTSSTPAMLIGSSIDLAINFSVIAQLFFGFAALRAQKKRGARNA